MDSSQEADRDPLESVDVTALRRTGLAPDYWYPLARAGDVAPGQAHGVTFAGEPIVLVRPADGSAPFALEDRCAHRQVPLRCGVVEGDRLRCGYHGWAYGSDGRCVSVPYLGPDRTLPNGVRAYACREAYGLIWVFPGDQSRAPAVPFPEIGNAQSAAYRTRYLDRRVACHYSFMHENLMDMNHQFLHRRLMGGIRALLLDFRQGTDWIEARYSFARTSGRQHWGQRFMLNRRKAPTRDQGRDVMLIRTQYPYQTLQFWKAGASEPALDLWNCYVPVDAEQRVNQTYGLMMIRRPKWRWVLDVAWPVIVWFTEGIFREDREIVELEQAAFDAQGDDWNNEIFPVIRGLKAVLTANGIDLEAQPAMAAPRGRAPCAAAQGGAVRWAGRS